MQRRTLLKSLPAAATPLALAGCTEDAMPDKQCENHCEMLEEWSWEWEGNGGLNPSTLTITFVPKSNSPPLDIELHGYETTGSSEPDLMYANTYTIEGSQTIIEERVEPVHAVEIEVTVLDES